MCPSLELKKFKKYTSKIIGWPCPHNYFSSISDVLATQREGEECGSCLNPDKNFFCGNCSVGLECVKGPVIDILLDAPSRCKKIQGNDIILHVN